MTVDDSFSSLGVAEWKGEIGREYCEIYSQAEIEIVYSEMGYEDEPQQVILAVTKKAVQKRWVPVRDEKAYTVDVKVTFVKQDPPKEDENGFIEPEPVVLDVKSVFYPLYIRTMGAMALASSATLAIFVVAL